MWDYGNLPFGVYPLLLARSDSQLCLPILSGDFCHKWVVCGGEVADQSSLQCNLKVADGTMCPERAAAQIPW